MRALRPLLAVALPLALALPTTVSSQQAIDSVYTATIRELTPTHPEWKFTTELVDHLPASATVPTPLKVLGYVPGTIGKLTGVADVNRYFRALDEASPRVELFSLGMSDEGREMLVAAIGDEATMRDLDRHRANMARLADTRGLSAAGRERLIRETKPSYWLTGAIHSPETGSPEMLMELAYRLAVDEGQHVQAIRRNLIVLITPVVEVDGRDRIVDAYRLQKELKLPGRTLVYWGKYTAHDNNRDGMALSQKLSRNIVAGFERFRPIVMHDLHESVPFLYTSTGTGPYNEEFDPILVNEWHQLAYQEINELTRRGLPGIWTHGFYDGWTPNYMLGVAQFRNSIGRFYETYTSSGADCTTANLGASQTSRIWYRTNPPVSGVRWCIRSNINFSQSGVLVAMRYVADHRETFLRNFVAKVDRQIRKGQTQAPYAFVIPRDQRRAAEAADLVNLFRMHGAEIHVATRSFAARDMPVERRRGPEGEAGETSGAAAGAAMGDSVVRSASGAARSAARGVDSTTAGDRRGATSPAAVGAETSSTTTTHTDSSTRGARRGSAADSTAAVRISAGDWVVRMDQPQTAMIRTLLASYRFRPDDPNPYDDTGWTIDATRNVTVLRVADSTILAEPMQALSGLAMVPGRVEGTGQTLLVPHLGDWRSAVLPWRVAPAKVAVADTAFSVNGESFPAGTFIVATPRGAAVQNAIVQLGLRAVAVGAAPEVRQHAITLPRVALMHSWLETQNEGWVRHAFDSLAIPYTYISTQTLRNPRALDRYDVVVFPHVNGSMQAIVHGRPMTGPAIPWKKSALTPSHGVYDSTDDIRPSMGLEGAAALHRFIERGGLLLVEGNSSRVPVELGITGGVSIPVPDGLRVRGAILRAQQGAASPILYGYENRTIAVHFGGQALFNVSGGGGGGGSAGAGAGTSANPALARPRAVLDFHSRADSLLVSGLLVGEDALAGRAAVVSAPVGKGHVVMFGIRPFWRWNTQGSFAMAINAIVNWNSLGAQSPRRVAAGLH